MNEVDFNHARVYVVNLLGKYYTTGYICTHMVSPLSEGKF